MKIEISHHIPSYPNYQVTIDGKVKNIKTNRYLKPSLNTKGYQFITLCNNGKRKQKTIHRLMGDFFLENFYNYPTIDHINRNKLDNRLKNLRWASYKMQNNNQNLTTIQHTDNKLKQLHITKDRNTYRVLINNKKIRFSGNFGTLKEAIKTRDQIISDHISR